MLEVIKCKLIDSRKPETMGYEVFVHRYFCLIPVMCNGLNYGAVHMSS